MIRRVVVVALLVSAGSAQERTRVSGARENVRQALGVQLDVLESIVRRSVVSTDTPYGLEVGAVEAVSPAARAGLTAGDVLLEWEGEPIRSVERLAEWVEELPVGSRAEVLYARRKEPVELLDRDPWETHRTRIARAPVVELPAGALEAAETIGAEGLREAIAVLSDDAMQGRAPASEGDARARKELIRRLEAIGFEPGAQGGWEQPVEIVGVEAACPERWTFRGSNGREPSFAWWSDYIAASGVQAPAALIEDAPIVFVGYGIQAPEHEWDDFKGADLAGKVLLMLNDDPDWDPALFAGERRLYYGRWTYKYESAARAGAAAAILIHTRDSAGYPWSVVQTSWSGVQYGLPAGDEPRLAVHGWMTEDAARRLVEAGGERLDALVAAARSRAFEPVPLELTTSFAFTNTLEATATANVIGLLRGSDEELAKEAVVVSAHHDHLGIGEPDAEGDRIYNGALDNASGVAQALEVARALTALPEPPRRSVLIALVGAEEQGLLGSRELVRSGPWPREDLVANVNFELGNVWGPTRDVTVFGLGKSTLEDSLANLARGQERVVVPEDSPEQGWYYRSDQLSFARAGVPAIWFRSGTDYRERPAGWGAERIDEWIESHYHRPSDELDPEWDLRGLVEDTRLGFLLVAAAAQGDTAPAWHPGTEFGGPR